MHFKEFPVNFHSSSTFILHHVQLYFQLVASQRLLSRFAPSTVVVVVKVNLRLEVELCLNRHQAVQLLVLPSDNTFELHSQMLVASVASKLSPVHDTIV